VSRGVQTSVDLHLLGDAVAAVVVLVNVPSEVAVHLLGLGDLECGADLLFELVDGLGFACDECADHVCANEDGALAVCVS
jgi:hypothetical protein